MEIKYIAVIVAIIVVVSVIAGINFLIMYGQQGTSVEEAPLIKIGTLRGGISSLDVIKAEALDEKYGFKAEVILFTSTLDLANALTHGDIDVAIIPVEFVAKLREKGSDIVVLAVDFYQNQAVVIRSGTAIVKVEDLFNNATIGAFKPTGTYAMFRAYMKSLYGVDVDELVVNAPPPQLVDAFKKGEVDAVVIWEPFVSQLVADYGGRILVTYQNLWSRWEGHVGNNGVMIVYAARADWANANKELVEKLLKARSEAAKLWNSNSDLAKRILTEQYGLSEEAARLCWERLKMEEATYLTKEMVDNSIAVWMLAKEGGYISSEPESLASGAFWLAG